MAKIILGTMTFGKTESSRVTDKEVVSSILNEFHKAGYDEIDTARVYCDGTTEELLSELHAPDKFKVATKVYPIHPGDHEPDKLKTTFKESLKALGVNQVEIFYLHAPDHSTPIESTLRAVQDLYEAGHFKKFGLSNYASWEVSAICEIMKVNNWVKPYVYQGMYNALTRDVEHELFPCLSKYNIKFYAFNPIAGGLLSPSYQSITQSVKAGSRFDPGSKTGSLYRKRYWNSAYFTAVGKIHQVAQQHGISPVDIAFQWLNHHSVLTDEDGIIFGASSLEQTVDNLHAVKKGKLPEDVIQAINDAWMISKVNCPPYFH
ncbi:NADP-dependent oxidoreductase domain-containing protein [Pilobolus umbonatus]|nr:NADP-dependent oxidoreductase domain-containing protein [Pilobolus umbonatus]